MNKEGKRLASVIKRTHKKLRKRYRQGTDENELWEEHIQDSSALQTYAEAMHTLATEHWEATHQVNTSRVLWTYSAIKQYFHKGEIQRITEKEFRKMGHLQLETELCHLPDKNQASSKIKVLDVGSCYNPFSVYGDFEVTAIDLCPALKHVKKCDFLNLQVKSNEKKSTTITRDAIETWNKHLNEREMSNEESQADDQNLNSTHVGKTPSLLNSSEVCNNSEKTSEICNASESTSKTKTKYSAQLCSSSDGNSSCPEEEVDKRDSSCHKALNKEKLYDQGTVSKENIIGYGDYVKIDQNVSDIENGVKTKISSSNEKVQVFDSELSTEISSLMSNSFDAVIFSLFLEYIPSPKQRFHCCKKAYDLLKPNGILCIITPDSKHQNANVHLYKLWKISLAFLGFSRTKYEKHAHFHGMLFRKGLCKRAWELDAEREIAVMKQTQVKSKFASIDYEKVSSEIYIPQDFHDLSESEEEYAND